LDNHHINCHLLHHHLLIKILFSHWLEVALHFVRMEEEVDLEEVDQEYKPMRLAEVEYQ